MQTTLCTLETAIWLFSLCEKWPFPSTALMIKSFHCALLYDCPTLPHTFDWIGKGDGGHRGQHQSSSSLDRHLYWGNKYQLTKVGRAGVALIFAVCHICWCFLKPIIPFNSDACISGLDQELLSFLDLVLQTMFRNLTKRWWTSVLKNG